MKTWNVSTHLNIENSLEHWITFVSFICTTDIFVTSFCFNFLVVLWNIVFFLFPYNLHNSLCFCVIHKMCSVIAFDPVVFLVLL